MALSDLNLSTATYSDLDDLITSISTVARTGGTTLTVNTTAPHGLAGGDRVTIFNLTNQTSSLTGTYEIASVTDLNTFTVTLNGGDFTEEAATGPSATESPGLIGEKYSGSTPLGVFITSGITLSAVDKYFHFNAFDGDGTGGSIPAANLRPAGSGVVGQGLYSFFKFAYRTVPRMPQFDFPMLSITNEQFEFINGWAIDNNRTLTQTLQVGNDNVLVDFTGTNTITTSDASVDFRQFTAGDQITVFQAATNNNVQAIVNSSTKNTIVANGTPFTDESDTISLSAEFQVKSSDLIRTAGYGQGDSTETYIKEYYAGVTTLGSLVDVVDQPYYFQEGSNTAATFNTKYTGPSNQVVCIRKIADASSNGYGDIDFVDNSAVTIAGTTISIDSNDSVYANYKSISATPTSILSDSVSAFTKVRPGDYIQITNSIGFNNNGVYSVAGVETEGDNDNTLILNEVLGGDSTDCDITLLDSIFAHGGQVAADADINISGRTLILTNFSEAAWLALNLADGNYFTLRGCGNPDNDRTYQIDTSGITLGILTSGTYDTITITINATPTQGTGTGISIVKGTFYADDIAQTNIVIFKSDAFGEPIRNTDFGIFVINDRIGISNTSSNDASITQDQRPLIGGLSVSGFSLAYSSGTFTTERSTSALLDADYRSAFKIFVREAGKTYAESSISDIGVSQLTYIVYRFPVTNTSDVKIFTNSDTEHDSQGTAQQTVPPDQTSLSGNDLTLMQLYFLRNPQTGADNLNITGVYDSSKTYVAGDVAQQLTNGRWYYCHQPSRAGNQSTLEGDNGAYSPVSNRAGTDLTWTAPGKIVGNGVDWNSTVGIAAGDIISISGSAVIVSGNHDGNNYKVASITTTTTTDDTINLVTNDPDFDTFAAADDGPETSTNADVYTEIIWKNWTVVPLVGLDGAEVDPPVFPSKGGYQKEDPALQGGERKVRTAHYAFDTIIDAKDNEGGNAFISASADDKTPYVDNGGSGNSSTGLYEFTQWALRRTGYINESASAADQDNYKRNGAITDLLVDFVGDTLVTRQGVFIDDIDVADQNAVSFVDYAGNSNITYPTVVSVALNFNSNLAGDADAVFYLYYKTLSGGVDNEFYFGNVNAQQVNRSDNQSVGADIQNKIINAAGTNNSRTYTFQYAYDEDTGGSGGGTKNQSVDVPVVAVAIGLGTGVYVQAEETITIAGVSISLVAPLERNYINP